MVAQEVLDELAVLLRDHRPQIRLELGGIELAHALVVAGDDDVDAVRTVADVLVDPVEFDLELLGTEPDRAQHPEPTRLRHCCHHVAAVGEREDRELDPELPGHFGLHVVSPVANVGWKRAL